MSDDNLQVSTEEVVKELDPLGRALWEAASARAVLRKALTENAELRAAANTS